MFDKGEGHCCPIPHQSTELGLGLGHLLDQGPERLDHFENGLVAVGQLVDRHFKLEIQINATEVALGLACQVSIIVEGAAVDSDLAKMKVTNTNLHGVLLWDIIPFDWFSKSPENHSLSISPL